MRENISTIFAVIVGVVILIIFPLFSIMSRQDSISYNKVLTLTTEFVDSVRNKGYFTEQEYTDYLVALSNTGNTYKVQLELHERILIKDVNNPEDEDLFVEDTLVYYNKDITKKLEEDKQVSFKENDEFYIKVYNTNITTASLLYNYFARVSIPPKVINIGYGGKVTHIAGTNFQKTDFSSTYSPYIKFGEVLNAAGENNKQCYGEAVGAYEMTYCTRVFNIEYAKNKTMVVPFSMYNFETLFMNSGAKKINGEQDFEDNKQNIAKLIKSKVKLRGFDIENEYEISVDSEELTYSKGVISGKIRITKIDMPIETGNRNTYILIEQGIGSGPTGILSSEAKTTELLVARIKRNPELQVLGPFTTKEVAAEPAKEVPREGDGWFKVVLNDYTSYNDIQFKLCYAETGEEVTQYFNYDGNNTWQYYKFSTTEIANKKEYWIKLENSVVADKEVYLEVTTDRNIADEGEDAEIISVVSNSSTFVCDGYDLDDLKMHFGLPWVIPSENVAPVQFVINVAFGEKDNYERYEDYRIWKSPEMMEYIKQLVPNLDISVTYLNERLGYDLNYEIKFDYENYETGNGGYHIYNAHWMRVYGTFSLYLSDTTRSFKSEPTQLAWTYTNICTGEEKKVAVDSSDQFQLTGVRIPEGFTIEYDFPYTNWPTPARKGNIYIKDNDTGKKFVWVFATKEDLEASEQLYSIRKSKPLYEETIYKAIKESLGQYGGFYIATESTPPEVDEDIEEPEEVLVYGPHFTFNNHVMYEAYFNKFWHESEMAYQNHPELSSVMAYSSLVNCAAPAIAKSVAGEPAVTTPNILEREYYGQRYQSASYSGPDSLRFNDVVSNVRVLYPYRLALYFK